MEYRVVEEISNTSFTFLNGECLESAAYNYVLRQLFITFRNSEKTYRYFEVPEKQYEELQKAISAGKFYNQQIKGWYKSELFC